MMTKILDPRKQSDWQKRPKNFDPVEASQGSEASQGQASQGQPEALQRGFAGEALQDQARDSGFKEALQGEASQGQARDSGFKGAGKHSVP